MKRNFLFVLIAALLLAPWPVVYAYEGVEADEASMIQPVAEEYGPRLQAYGGAIGEVSPGGLFIIDMTSIQADTNYELIIANANELVSDFRFMNLKVGLFVQGADDCHWNRLKAANGDPLPDIYITMFGGRVDFNLPGGGIYKVVIDTGCFYCYGVSGGDAIATPSFYISAL